MKVGIILYALLAVTWAGVVFGQAPEEAKRHRLRVVLASLIWPIVLAYAVGQTLGKWAGRQ